MARRKRHITIDGNSHIIEPEASIEDALRAAGFETLPPGVISGGELITAPDYDRPVPAHSMITNQTDMVKGGSPIRESLLNYELELITRFLSEFPGKRSIHLDDNYLLIRNFPLPDSYTLDHVDLLFLISGYYEVPPAGLYIHSKTPNRDQIAAHLGGHLMGATLSFALEHIPEKNRDQAKKLAELGWGCWVCFHFKDWTWKLNPSNLLAGDGLYKLIENVFVALAGKHK